MVKNNLHLIDKQMLDYIAERDSQDERNTAKNHLASCHTCQNKLDDLKFRVILSGLYDFEKERPYNGSCPSESTLKKCATKWMDMIPDERAEIGIHLIHCATCNAKYLNMVSEYLQSQEKTQEVPIKTENIFKRSKDKISEFIFQIPSGYWQSLSTATVTRSYSYPSQSFTLSNSLFNEMGYKTTAEINIISRGKKFCDLSIILHSIKNQPSFVVLEIPQRTNKGISAPFKSTGIQSEYCAQLLQIPWASLSAELKVKEAKKGKFK